MRCFPSGTPFGHAETRITRRTSAKSVQTNKIDAGIQARSTMVFVGLSVLKQVFTGMPISCPSFLGASGCSEACRTHACSRPVPQTRPHEQKGARHRTCPA